jgi:hypothetical protein
MMRPHTVIVSPHSPMRAAGGFAPTWSYFPGSENLQQLLFTP